MHVCVYMFKYVSMHEVYMIHTYIFMYDVYVIHTSVSVHESACMCGELEKKSGEERSMYASAHLLTRVCMCEFMYACIYRHEYVYVWAYVSVCLSIMHVYLYRHIYVLLYTWVWICMHGCIWASTYMYIQMYKCKCVARWCYLKGYNSSRHWYYYKQSFSPGR